MNVGHQHQKKRMSFMSLATFLGSGSRSAAVEDVDQDRPGGTPICDFSSCLLVEI